MNEEITSIYQALAAVQAELKAPKNQRNSFGNYNYRSCEDIFESVKPLLAKHGLTLVISDEIINIPSSHAPQVVEMVSSKGAKSSEVIGGDRFYVKAEATVWDAAGELISVSAYARESQNKSGMDDSQITGSTSSYARKYALNGLFLIDDTKDADANEHRDQVSSSPTKSTPSASKPSLRSDQSKPEPISGSCEVIGCKNTVKDVEKSKHFNKGHVICYTHSTNGDWESNIPQDDEGPTTYDYARDVFPEVPFDQQPVGDR